MNPHEREYTFYSHYQESHSRIDLFIISNTLVDSVVNCEIGVIALSDHGTVDLHVNLKKGMLETQYYVAERQIFQ